ncbi:MAG: molybdopterin molybdotransferase MoeA, partial [Saprospiraceae bacterium]
MITVAAAQDIILSTTKDFGTESLPLAASLGKVLREDLTADRDFPPYDRVTMDGIAIHWDSFDQGSRSFPIAGIAAAGAPPLSLANPATCLEVMTGSILPAGVDTVIRYEDLNLEDQVAHLTVDSVKKGQNIHRQGEDRQRGDLLVTQGRIISSAEIGVAATIGKTHLKTSRLPKTIIISTGDELVEIDQKPLAHQIRKSNIHQLAAILKTQQITADTFHLNDELDEILVQLERIVQNYEVVLLSGGVSKGKFDFLPSALEKLGVKKLFHRIQQRPGKPFWFGQHPSGTVVFALPGNPVSSFLCTHRYFLPWLRQSVGLPVAPAKFAVLQKSIDFKPDLTYFLEVKISYSPEGQILALPIRGNGSGDLANLVDADAVIELPQGKNQYP